jgi:hypothetical protein
MISGKSNIYHFLNSDEKYKVDWRQKFGLSGFQGSSRKAGSCIAILDNNMHRTACELPAGFTCQDPTPVPLK